MMKRHIFTIFISICLLISCAHAQTTPVSTTSPTVLPSPIPTETLTPAQQLTTTPALDPVVQEMMAKQIPSVKVDGQNVVISVNAETSITMPIDKSKERIQVADNGAYLIKNESEKENIAIFDTNLKTERWGKGERWITRDETVRLTDFTYTDITKFKDSDYDHDKIVEIPEGDWDALDEALYLGKVFAPSFPDSVKGVDPSEVNWEVFTDIKKSGFKPPLGFRNSPDESPVKYFNNIVFSFRNNSGTLFFTSIQQEAVKNADGNVRVLSFDVTRNVKDTAIALTISGRANGDADSTGNYAFPRLAIIPNIPFTLFERLNLDRFGLVDSNGNIDPEVSQVMKEWLTTGNLPETIKGIPIEKVITGLTLPYNIVEGRP